ncbi:MAG: hypothetical protein AAF356_04020 [Planctomycetota bacterium]
MTPEHAAIDARKAREPAADAAGRAGIRRLWSPAGRVVSMVHILGLALWLASIAASALAAARLFPKVRELDAAAGGVFAAYAGDRPSLLAGNLAADIFALADIGQFGGATLALATLIVLLIMGLPTRSLASAARLLGVGLAMGLISYKLFVLDPRMQVELRSYWEAAAINDVERAEAHRAAFNADHPQAAGVMRYTAIAVLIGLGGAAWGAPLPTSTTRTNEATP